MLDDIFEDDARVKRLEARLQVMIRVLEMEFQATPDDIVTGVISVVFDRDPAGVVDSLKMNLNVLRNFIPGGAQYKVNRRYR